MARECDRKFAEWVKDKKEVLQDDIDTAIVKIAREAAEIQGDSADGMKRSVEIRLLNAKLVMDVSSFQEEVATRFARAVKAACINGKYDLYPMGEAPRQEQQCRLPFSCWMLH